MTPNDRASQPGFEDADTSVAAAVPLYGRYDWVSREGLGRGQFMAFLERLVVRRRFDDAPEVFRAAAPLLRVHPKAPPFFVLHGAADSLIPVEEAREFVERCARCPAPGRLRRAARRRARIRAVRLAEGTALGNRDEPGPHLAPLLDTQCPGQET